MCKGYRSLSDHMLLDYYCMFLKVKHLCTMKSN